MTLEQFSSGFIWKAPTIHPWTIKESCSSRPAFLSALVDGPLNLSVTPSLKNVIVNQWKKYMETIQAIFWLPDPIFPCSNSSKSINHPFLMDGTLSSCHACGIKGKIYMLINIFSSFQKLSANFIFPFIMFRYQEAHTFVRNVCCSVPNLPAAASVDCFLTTVHTRKGLISLL